jgi:hypothetical protein
MVLAAALRSRPKRVTVRIFVGRSQQRNFPEAFCFTPMRIRDGRPLCGSANWIVRERLAKDRTIVPRPCAGSGRHGHSSGRRSVQLRAASNPQRWVQTKVAAALLVSSAWS